jgi:hypothetical protein
MAKKSLHDLWQRLKALQSRLDQAPQADFVEGLLLRHAFLDALHVSSMALLC